MLKLKQHIYEEPTIKLFVVRPCRLCAGSNFSTEGINDSNDIGVWDGDEE